MQIVAGRSGEIDLVFLHGQLGRGGVLVVYHFRNARETFFVCLGLLKSIIEIP